MANTFQKGWKFYQDKKEKSAAEVEFIDLGGYCYPNTMLEGCDVERELALTN